MNNVFRVATYNLRYANDKDTGNLWVDRAPVVINLIRFHDFDILATQEGLKAPLDHISEALPYYQRYGIARDDGKTSGEHCAIFFNKEKFDLLNGGNFWLSENPSKPGYGWDAKHNRLCTWVQLFSKFDGKILFVFNAHFDHYGVAARNASSELVLQKMVDIAGSQACILAGDFNTDHGSQSYNTLAQSPLLEDVYSLVEHPYVNNPSFNSWGNPSVENRLIDHLFISAHFQAKKYGILTDTYFSKMPSDHFPVMADLFFTNH